MGSSPTWNTTRSRGLKVRKTDWLLSTAPLADTWKRYRHYAAGGSGSTPLMTANAGLAELVDALHSKRSVERRKGSIPLSGTLNLVS